MELKDRWIDLSELPKIGKNSVDWENSVGCKINFKYKDVEGFFKISELAERKYGTSHVVCEYNGEKKIMNTQSIKNCQIGSLIGLYKKHNYKIGEKIKTLTGEIVLTKNIIIEKYKSKPKGFEYKCLICGNIDEIPINRLCIGSGCNVCGEYKILEGFNDLKTRRKDVYDLLLDKTIGTKVMAYSSQNANFICPDCGHIEEYSIARVSNSGFSCKKCSDNISFGEKFVIDVLNQLNIKFKRQKRFNWSNRKIYDFFIEEKNCIIEVHGDQHYSDCLFNNFQSNKQKKIDVYKEDMANKNGISEYIILKCVYSENINFKNEIISSKLSSIYDLSQVDWDNAYLYTSKNLIKDISYYYQNITNNIDAISNNFNADKNSIIRCLKKGNDFGFCDYKENKKKKNIKIICLNNEMVFDSHIECSNYFNLNPCLVSSNCNGKNKYVKSKQEYYQFQNYEDYIKNPKKLLDEKEIRNNSKTKKIICLNDNKIFNSITLASEYYKVERCGIGCCCRGVQKTTGNGLKFKYYEEEINGLCES